MDNMIFISDLLDLKNRNLYLEIDGKKIPMSLHYYVASEIFFFEVNDCAKLHTLDELRTVLEEEAEDRCWGDDIYIAPMERISSCEIKFPKDFSEVTSIDVFDNCYTIIKIETTMDDVIIKLK